MSFLHLEGVDDATAAVVIRLHTEDLEEMESRNKGKYREDESCDSALAQRLYMDELKGWGLTINDRVMSRSIASAVISDGPVLAACQERERLETQDHQAARQMGGLQPVAVPNDNATNLTDRDIYRLRDSYVLPVNINEEVQPSSSRNGGKGSFNTHIQCDICPERKPFFDVVQLPCDHNYCAECLRRLFEASIVDESLFPPRCCRKPIPVEHVRLYLTPDIVERLW